MTQPSIKELKFPRVVVVNLCILLGSLCMTLILFPVSKFTLSRLHAGLTLCIYAGFLAYNIFDALTRTYHACG